MPTYAPNPDAALTAIGSDQAWKEKRPNETEAEHAERLATAERLRGGLAGYLLRGRDDMQSTNK